MAVGFIELAGRPITKKNSPRIVRYGGFSKVIPSKAFCAYELVCLEQLKYYDYSFRNTKVEVVCKYWMQDKRGFPDLVNLLSATHDILEKAGILDNDRNIVSCDGSRIVGFSKHNPRVEIFIKEVDYDYEVEQ